MQWKAESALSSAGIIVDQTIRAQSTAKDAIAEARALRTEVSSRMAEILQRAELRTSSAMGELTVQMKEVTAHIQVQTSHAIAKIRQQL